MKRMAITVAALIVAAAAWAQNLKVTGMELSSKAVPGVEYPVDLNGVKCGLVEVALDAEGVAFEGNVIGTPVHADGVYRIFMTQGTRFLNIKYPGSEPVLVNFRDYNVDRLLSQSVLTIKAEEPDHDIAAQLDSNIGDVSDEAEDLYTQAERLIAANDLSKSFELLNKAHELGHPKATYQLGWIYTDPYKAARNPMVERMSGMHFPDNPVPRDMSMAAKLYEQSAEAGYVQAQVAIALCYEKGNGVKKDKKKALEWYTRAAEQGHLEAQAKIGKKVKTKRMLGIAVSFGSADTQFLPSDFSANPTDLSAATQGRADKNGNACALVKVMLPFEKVTFSGDVVGDTPFKTNEYWVYMPQGSKELTINYPEMAPLSVHFKDFGIDRVEAKTTYAMRLSFPIDLLEDGSQLSGEECYRIGIGYQERRDNQYLRWMTKAADLKHPLSMAMVGQAYLYGTSVKKDIKRGQAMLEESSSLGCGQASYFLGTYYELIKRNSKLAQKWYDTAAEQGYDLAKNKKAKKRLGGLGNIFF